MKTEKQMLIEANEIIRSFNSIVDRKGADTNWEALDKRIKTILKEQHEILYPKLDD